MHHDRPRFLPRSRTAAALIAVLALLATAVPDAGAAEPRTLIVSRHSSGPYGNDHSGHPSISDDGRFVAFESTASNLVSGDSNGAEDVFVHDLMTGRTTLVSRHSVGTYGNNDSRRPSISDDGRYVAFESLADNLVSGDTNGAKDTFVHDRLASTTGRTTLVSRHSVGTYGNNDSSAPSISDDGRFVSFASQATNLVSGDTNGTQDVFVHDRLASTTGRTTRVSRHSLGNEATLPSFNPSISGDGRFVAFGSSASNLVSGDTNGVSDIFVHDRLASTTGRTTLVSRHSLGSYGNDSSFAPSINGDGRYVAFYSSADNLVSGDTNGMRDAFVHDRLASTTGRTTRVSRHSLGTEANNHSEDPAISSDGRFVAFPSSASNLVSDDDNGKDDIFIHDRLASTTGRTTIVSRHSLGTEANNHSNPEHAINGDGRFVAFYSPATNLVSGDTNGKTDVFVHRRY